MLGTVPAERYLGRTDAVPLERWTKFCSSVLQRLSPSGTFYTTARLALDSTRKGNCGDYFSACIFALSISPLKNGRFNFQNHFTANQTGLTCHRQGVGSVSVCHL
jgi:hypothetical protein